MGTSSLGLTVIENRLRQAFGGVVPFVGIIFPFDRRNFTVIDGC
jgi:hypothetical protein